ncbi:MAG TPA: hypothetical protein VHZ78_14690 [Rhizomicrobium sp.]|jgi:hypothetical protein|nr:hypothetical protein [Rhizomicrobium sp.]
MRHAICFVASLTGLIVIGAAAPALAQIPPPSTTDAAKPDPNALICRNGAPAIGSRLGVHRICATRVQWEHYRNDSRDATTYAQAHIFYEQADPVGTGVR